MAGKTITEQLADLKATREAKQNEMQAILQKSIDAGRSTDTAEAEAFDTLDAEVKTLDADITRLTKMEAVQKGAARPVKNDAEEVANTTAHASAQGV